MMPEEMEGGTTVAEDEGSNRKAAPDPVADALHRGYARGYKDAEYFAYRSALRAVEQAMDIFGYGPKDAVDFCRQWLAPKKPDSPSVVD